MKRGFWFHCNWFFPFGRLSFFVSSTKEFLLFYFIFFSISIHDSLSCFTRAHTGARLQNGSGDRNLYFRWFCWTWKRQTFTFTPQFMRFLCFYFFFRCFVLFSMCLFFFSILGVLILEVLLISLLWNSSRTHSFTRIRTHTQHTLCRRQSFEFLFASVRVCVRWVWWLFLSMCLFAWSVWKEKLNEKS